MVGDPFMGSGTTAVETRLAGREGWGRDLNPLAVRVARAKTADLDLHHLESLLSTLESGLAASKEDEIELPFCTNMEHWFRPEVAKDLALVKSLINGYEAEPERNFFLVCLSAIIREVSNADPRHVFPGYSKRMRELDRLGRMVDVRRTFVKGCQRRIGHYAKFRQAWPAAMSLDLRVGDSCTDELPPCDLMVTNPPYLGSIRYLETMKLEMYWLSLLADSEEYRLLDRQLLASERWYKQEYAQPISTGVSGLDAIIERLYHEGHEKMGYVTGRYFLMISAFLRSASGSLRTGGHLVVKMSDSFVRIVTVPAHEYWIQLAAEHGLDVVACRTDDYHSRSLLTKRNSFSRMLPHDYLLVFRRD